MAQAAFGVLKTDIFGWIWKLYKPLRPKGDPLIVLSS